jgi:hypothetical protein
MSCKLGSVFVLGQCEDCDEQPGYMRQPHEVFAFVRCGRPDVGAPQGGGVFHVAFAVDCVQGRCCIQRTSEVRRGGMLRELRLAGHVKRVGSDRNDNTSADDNPSASDNDADARARVWGWCAVHGDATMPSARGREHEYE